MVSLLQIDSQQIPLIHIIEADDRILLNSPDAEWFKVLYYFPSIDYRDWPLNITMRCINSI